MALDLKSIKEREHRADPSPWCWVWAGEKSNVSIVGIGMDSNHNRLSGHIDNPDDLVEPAMELGGCDGWGNTDFIAHARTDIPVLVTEVEQLRELNTELLNVCERVHWQGQGHLLKGEFLDDEMVNIYLSAGLLRQIAIIVAEAKEQQDEMG